MNDFSKETQDDDGRLERWFPELDLNLKVGNIFSPEKSLGTEECPRSFSDVSQRATVNQEG